MDFAVNPRITLAEARATAPRGFDKQLIDWLAAIQDGQRPIETAFPAPVLQPGVAYNDAELRGMIATLQQQVQMLSESIANAAAAYLLLEARCRTIDERISGFNLEIRQVA